MRNLDVKALCTVKMLRDYLAQFEPDVVVMLSDGEFPHIDEIREDLTYTFDTVAGRIAHPVLEISGTYQPQRERAFLEGIGRLEVHNR